MAFVQGYQHDIFISYAHVDNEPVGGADTGWVSTLVRTLRILLGQKLGRADAFSLWMDYRLLPNEPLTPALLDTLGQTATVVLILSPGYLASAWCQRECNTFLQMTAERLRGGTRVFVVEREPVDITAKPEELRDLLGYRFWVQEPDRRAPRLLGFPQPLPGDPYYDLLNDLAFDLATELKRLRELTASPPVSAPATRPAVFLAEVTDNLLTQRDEVKRYLDQVGFRVLPDADLYSLYWRDPEALTQVISGNLHSCRLFVQLLSGLTGRHPPAQPTLARVQYEAARQAGKPILQWRAPELPAQTETDPDQWALLTGDQVFVGNLEAFKREVRTRADAKPPPTVAPSAGKLVFLDAGAEDKALVLELGRLLKAQGMAFTLPVRKGTPMEVRQDFEDCVLCSDGVVVFYGASSHVWVRQQLRQCFRLEGQRDRPLKVAAVYEGPPGDKEPLDFERPDMLMIDCRQGLDESRLQPLLAALQTGGGR